MSSAKRITRPSRTRTRTRVPSSRKPDIINLSNQEGEVMIVPLHGLVHDSPIITAIQKSTRKGRKTAVRRKQAVKEIDASIEAYGKLFRGIARIFNIPTK
jgi:hypothetical protein